MKPVRLTIQALGPFLGRKVVDFREAMNWGLFGIYGPTGSGKSSMFNAISFALFGEPTRSEQDASSLRSDHADPKTQTEVELVFDLGDKRYFVIRRPAQPRPKARGQGETQSPHEAYLFDATGLSPDAITQGSPGRILAERRVRDVDAAIKDLLRYGPDQFRQIVLLPQGRFERFLAANTRDRLGILRDLFDVSLYERLRIQLAEQAKEIERELSTRREVWRRKLEEVGCTTLGDLEEKIRESLRDFRQLRRKEEAFKAKLNEAEEDSKKALIIDRWFQEAEATNQHLENLEKERVAMNRLAEKVALAEKARVLAETERRVRDARREVREAQEALHRASVALQEARNCAEEAKTKLSEEQERSAEIDGLQDQKRELERYLGILKDAEDRSEHLSEAIRNREEAGKRLEDARNELAQAKELHQKKSGKLKAAREAAGKRAGIQIRLFRLEADHSAAVAFETAWRDVELAAAAVKTAEENCAEARARAEAARQACDTAEKQLLQAHALHLATTLVDGSPCPVCGSCEHPAPATGDLEHANLDQNFRAARKNLPNAEQQLHTAEQKLAAEKATLCERRKRAEALARPNASAAELADQIAAAKEQLEALGPEIDLGQAEAEVETLQRKIESAETACHQLRDAFEDKRNQETNARAALERMLADVPTDKRDPHRLRDDIGEVTRKRDERISSLQHAQKAERSASDRLIRAENDHQNAQCRLTSSMEAEKDAKKDFKNRLEQEGLTAETFETGKAGIATLENDKARLEKFERDVASASEAVKTYADRVAGIERPDLNALETLRDLCERQFDHAKRERMKARADCRVLTKLRRDLKVSARRIEEAEASSGPLRHLAALMNGENRWQITLETYAIGAMFDQVLEAANWRLGRMTAGRYRLERDLEDSGRGRRGPGIQVFDLYTGKARSTTTLSGGETFIAALALALGLADVVERSSGKVRLDTIFIDEGFGGLDTENGAGTLDQVLQVLNSLVTQGRVVGLISHVPLVQEAVPNGFYVRKGPTGSSIETRGLDA